MDGIMDIGARILDTTAAFDMVMDIGVQAFSEASGEEIHSTITQQYAMSTPLSYTIPMSITQWSIIQQAVVPVSTGRVA